MNIEPNKIQKIFSELNGISIETPFSSDSDSNIIGKISLVIEDSKEILNFDVKIYPEYPLKRLDTESITFFNTDLLEYGHVMGNGAICIHTAHHIDLEKKIKIDIDSLKRWIIKYYINKENDNHYEHLIYQPRDFNNIYFSYLFTKVNYLFSKNQFGFFEYSKLIEGLYIDKTINNHIVQNFKNPFGGLLAECEWSDSAKQVRNKNNGLFVFLENPPAIKRKFIVNNWKDLVGLVNSDFFKFLDNFQKNNQKIKGAPVPLLVGYKISDSEIHWQVAILEIGKFPLESYKENKIWGGRLVNEEILWGITRNCSYQYFFGRGRLTEGITKSKILIIVIGAIGSIVATTLTRSGCTIIYLVDYDIKEPENVCRSEYSFITGLCNKTDDLANELFRISPFVDVGILESDKLHFYSKVLHGVKDLGIKLEERLCDYDLIIDCSTDNDLLYVLNQLHLNRLVTMSITNNAKDLVCSVEPRSYDWVMNQFENVLENDLEDIHNPTGCWSPTFKASYNDISTLVQFAIKHLNLKFCDESRALRNFVLKTEVENGFNIKLNEF
jgi:hypothetical protein